MKGGATFKFHRVATVFLKSHPAINNVLEDLKMLQDTPAFITGFPCTPPVGFAHIQMRLQKNINPIVNIFDLTENYRYR
jgi:hypothetical protein